MIKVGTCLTVMRMLLRVDECEGQRRTAIGVVSRHDLEQRIWDWDLHLARITDGGGGFAVDWPGDDPDLSEFVGPRSRVTLKVEPWVLVKSSPLWDGIHEGVGIAAFAPSNSVRMASHGQVAAIERVPNAPVGVVKLIGRNS